jgi:hypothetical protein
MNVIWEIRVYDRNQTSTLQISQQINYLCLFQALLYKPILLTLAHLSYSSA